MNQLSFSYRRVQKLILMFLLTLLGPCIAGIIGQRPLDTIIVWIFVSIFFYLGFLLYLEHTRVTGQLSRGMSNSFGLIFFVSVRYAVYDRFFLAAGVLRAVYAVWYFLRKRV